MSLDKSACEYFLKKQNVFNKFLIKNLCQFNNFFFHYQPIVDLSSDNIVIAGEALLREVDIVKKYKLPANFLKKNYMSGHETVINFDKFVLKKNMDFLIDLSKHKIKTILHVNISGNFFLEKNGPAEFIEKYLKEKKAFHLIRFLTIEIVEWIDFNLTFKTIENVKKCRDLGIAVWLDDAGTGVAGLNLFTALPFNGIKIDKMFVQEIDTQLKSFNIVKMLNKLAHDSGCEIIAEGVATEEQKKIIFELGIKYAQGYLFSHPLNKKDFVSML